jgi:AraC-like DNA-binding protein
MNANTEVLWISKFDYPAGVGFRPHSHPFYQIIFIISGCASFLVSGERVCADRGYWVLFKPGQEHRMEKVEDGVVKTLDIKFTIGHRKIAEQVMRLDTLLTSSDKYVPFLLDRIRAEGRRQNRFFKEISNSLLMEMLVIMVREYLPGGEVGDTPYGMENAEPGSSIEKSIVEYVSKNYQGKITLDMLSASLGYNKNYLCQKFKNESGITINEFIQKYRIGKSKDLIKFSDYDLKTISDLTGFENIHHFSRIFKQIEGAAPGTYKKMERSDLGKAIVFREGYVDTDKIDR